MSDNPQPPQEENNPQPPESDSQQSEVKPTESDVSGFDDSDNSEQAPVLKTWKTSVGFSILGFFVGFPAFILLSAFVGTMLAGLIQLVTGVSDLGNALTSSFTLLIGWTLQIIYAAKFYPSYFKEKPLLKSSNVISFANATFGSFIGFLWNNNLTKKNKGVSNVIVVVLTILLLVSSIVGVGLGLMSVASNGSAPVNKTIERPADATIYTDKESGASFVVPDNWSEEALNQSRTFVKAKFYPDDASSTDPSAFVATISYATSDLWNELTAEEKRGYKRSDLNNGELSSSLIYSMLGSTDKSEKIQKVNLDGTDYYKVTNINTSDLNLSSTGQEAMNLVEDVTLFIRLENGYWHQYQYYAVKNSPYYQDFVDMVASAIYQ